MADPLEEIADLIAAVGACYQRGRRYREIATRCEEHYLARALEIGSEVRQAARREGIDAATAVRAAEALRTLLNGCESAIAEVRAGASYRRAVAAWEHGRGEEVTEAALAVFTAVERYPECAALYHPLAIAAARGSRDHFIAPQACVEMVVEISRSGIAAARTPPELGADEVIRAVVLSDDLDLVESPVVVVIDPKTLDLPVCRIAPAGDALVYTPRVQAPVRVHLASVVTDEWWAVSPGAYRRYADAVRRELAVRGITVLDERAG